MNWITDRLGDVYEWATQDALHAIGSVVGLGAVIGGIAAGTLAGVALGAAIAALALTTLALGLLAAALLVAGLSGILRLLFTGLVMSVAGWALIASMILPGDFTAEPDTAKPAIQEALGIEDTPSQNSPEVVWDFTFSIPFEYAPQPDTPEDSPAEQDDPETFAPQGGDFRGVLGALSASSLSDPQPVQESLSAPSDSTKTHPVATETTALQSAPMSRYGKDFDRPLGEALARTLRK